MNKLKRRYDLNKEAPITAIIIDYRELRLNGYSRVSSSTETDTKFYYHRVLINPKPGITTKLYYNDYYDYYYYYYYSLS